MKDSGIEWIGEIPEDWEVSKIKSISDIYTGNSIPTEIKDIYTDFVDAIPYIATKDISLESNNIDYKNGIFIKNEDKSFKRAPANSTLLCIEGGSAGRKIAFTDQVVAFGNKLCCFKSCEEISKYIYYYLQSPAFKNEFNLNTAGLIGGVSIGLLKNHSITIPPLIQQKKISNFLDQKVSEIDHILEKTRESIEEYKKYKQSLITEAVTKGLNPDVEMKDSGIEWIGEMPKHWKLERIKNVLFPHEKPINEADEIITCFRSGQVTLRSNVREEGYTFSDTEKGYKGIDIGDIVIHGMDAFGGAIGISDSRGKCTPVYHVCSSNQNLKYMVFYLRILAMNNVLMALSSGVRIRSSDYRNWNKLAVILSVIPPLPEQNTIVDFLEKKLNEIDGFILKKENFIHELVEYRKSLIYEVVTGKKEIK